MFVVLQEVKFDGSYIREALRKYEKSTTLHLRFVFINSFASVLVSWPRLIYQSRFIGANKVLPTVSAVSISNEPKIAEHGINLR